MNGKKKCSGQSSVTRRAICITSNFRHPLYFQLLMLPSKRLRKVLKFSPRMLIWVHNKHFLAALCDWIMVGRYMPVFRALMSGIVCFHYRACVWLNVAEFPLKEHNGLSDQLAEIRNRNTKHLFTHLSLPHSLSLAASFPFCFRLSLAYNSISFFPSLFFCTTNES